MTQTPGRAGSLDVLIPTRDRPTRLVAMLGSLSAQELPRDVSTRLYLLDNGETSAFVDFDVARQLDVLELRGIQTYYLRRPHLAGMYQIRSYLYEAGGGEVACYLDDDVVLPPATLRSLWSGVVDHGFALAASLVLDVDALHDDEIGHGHHVADTLHSLADDLERDELATVDGTWMEMVSPFGTNLMFRRSVFDSVGGWAWMAPVFASKPGMWSEDVGLCVALKSAGGAYVDVARIVAHLSPRQRSFAGWQTPPALSKALIERYGADHPSSLVSPDRCEFRAAAVARRLREMADRFS